MKAITATPIKMITISLIFLMFIALYSAISFAYQGKPESSATSSTQLAKGQPYNPPLNSDSYCA